MNTTTVPTSQPIALFPNDIHDVIAALDNRRVDSAGNQWTAYVLGVHTDDGADYWIQVGSDKTTGAALVLHLLPDATAEGVIAALACWDPLHAPPQTIITADARGPVSR